MMTKRYALGTMVLLLFLTLPASGQTRSTDAAAFGLGFGGAVAVGDHEIFVGSAPIGWPRGQEPAGTVYLFTRNADGAWTESARIKAADGHFGDQFGRTLYVQGSTLMVGAPGAQAAYVFEKDDTGTWTETGKLTPSSLDTEAEFGGAYERGGFRTGVLAMAGGRMVVTSYNSDTSTGAVHVFNKTGPTWHEEAILHPDDAQAGDGFGWSVVAEGDQVFVGAPNVDDRKGALYVFAREASGTWVQAMRLTDEALTTRSQLGQALAIRDGRLYAGAPGFQRFGAVFVFAGVQGMWTPVDRLVTGAPAEGSRRFGGFGTSLAASADHLLISARGSVVAFPITDHRADTSSAQSILPVNDRSRAGFGVGLAVHGDVAVIGSPSADYEEGLATLYEHSSETGAWKPGSTLISEVAYLASIAGNQIDCQDGAADVFGCERVDLVSFLSVEELAPTRGVKMTDLWGWEDPQTGKEYVLQARTDGVAFVDISNPHHPIYVGQLMKTTASPGSAWRDVKVYKDHAFVVADGASAHGLQIFDLTRLRDVDPAAMPVTFDVTAHYLGIHSTHNIVINEETGFAYAVGNRSGGETCGGQLHMINIQDPANPRFAGCFTHAGAGGTHDSQCVLYRGGDTDYQGKEICFNSNGSSFIIADVTDKDKAVTVAHATYPNTAYTHQGWLSEDHNYFYMNDELDELNGGVPQTRTLIWDVQDLDDPLLVKEFLLNSKASDHNLYVREHLMYQSNYQSGLRILDISDPVNPVEVGHFDTVPFGEDEPGFGGSWSNYPFFKSGIIAVSSRGEGLFLVRKSDVDL